MPPTDGFHKPSGCSSTATCAITDASPGDTPTCTHASSTGDPSTCTHVSSTHADACRRHIHTYARTYVNTYIHTYIGTYGGKERRPSRKVHTYVRTSDACTYVHVRRMSNICQTRIRQMSECPIHGCSDCCWPTSCPSQSYGPR